MYHFSAIMIFCAVITRSIFSAQKFLQHDPYSLLFKTIRRFWIGYIYTHVPLFALLKIASIAFIFATPSSMGVGTLYHQAQPEKKRSPCNVYWLLTSKVISSILPSRSSQIRHGRSTGAFAGLHLYPSCCAENMNTLIGR